MRRATSRTIACWAPLVAAACLGTAAQEPPAPPASPLPEGLEDTVFTADAIGLSMHLPAGAHVTLVPEDDGIVYLASDAPQARLWRARIEQITWTDESRPGVDDANAFLDLVLSRQPESRVIVRGPVIVDGRDARQCYTERTFPDGQQAVHGWIVLPAEPGTLVVFTLSVLPEHFPDFKPLFDRSLATVDLRTEAERSLEHRSRIEHGRRFLESVTPERLRSLVGLRQWFRTFRPASEDGSTPERELACSVVEVLAAPRGTLLTNRDPEQYTPEQRVEGLLVRVQGRIVIDPRRDAYFDTLAQYWMSWDQSGEEWSVRTTQRQGQASRTEAETGLRLAPSVGQPRPKLTVVKSDAPPTEWRVPEVYMSQALSWLLGRLLPRDATEPRFYTYYYYNARGVNPSVTLRYDRWEPSGDGSGQWTLATLLDKNSPPDVTTYDADGALVRRVRPTGEVTLPTSRVTLLQLWRAQGLRTGSADQ